MGTDPMRRLAAAFAGRADVDAAAGLRCTSGDAELYAELLRVFFERDDVLRLSRAVADGDDAAARRQAHELRRRAAALGLTGISEPAAALGSAIGESPWHALDLTRRLQRNFAELKDIVDML